jgi:hypothetical protein
MYDSYDEFWRLLVFKMSILLFGGNLGSQDTYQALVTSYLENCGIRESFDNLRKELEYDKK